MVGCASGVGLLPAALGPSFLDKGVGISPADVHEIYTIKYSHIYIFSLTFMLFCD